jgi:hypothetical protein
MPISSRHPKNPEPEAHQIPCGLVSQLKQHPESEAHQIPRRLGVAAQTIFESGTDYLFRPATFEPPAASETKKAVCPQARTD